MWFLYFSMNTCSTMALSRRIWETQRTRSSKTTRDKPKKMTAKGLAEEKTTPEISLTRMAQSANHWRRKRRRRASIIDWSLHPESSPMIKKLRPSRIRSKGRSVLSLWQKISTGQTPGKRRKAKEISRNNLNSSKKFQAQKLQIRSHTTQEIPLN